jgi:hypothetical protein
MRACATCTRGLLAPSVVSCSWPLRYRPPVGRLSAACLRAFKRRGRPSGPRLSTWASLILSTAGAGRSVSRGLGASPSGSCRAAPCPFRGPPVPSPTSDPIHTSVAGGRPARPRRPPALSLWARARFSRPRAPRHMRPLGHCRTVAAGERVSPRRAGRRRPGGSATARLRARPPPCRSLLAPGPAQVWPPLAGGLPTPPAASSRDSRRACAAYPLRFSSER